MHRADNLCQALIPPGVSMRVFPQAVQSLTPLRGLGQTDVAGTLRRLVTFHETNRTLHRIDEPAGWERYQNSAISLPATPENPGRLDTVFSIDGERYLRRQGGEDPATTEWYHVTSIDPSAELRSLIRYQEGRHNLHPLRQQPVPNLEPYASLSIDASDPASPERVDTVFMIYGEFFLRRTTGDAAPRWFHLDRREGGGPGGHGSHG
jgi:hypothetical protein